MSDRRALSLVVILALGLSATACQRTSINIGGVTAQSFSISTKEAAIRYEKILKRLGPPVRVLRLNEGFVLLYRAVTISESNLTLSFNQIKAAYSRGENHTRFYVFFFAEDGRLSSWGARSLPLALGWGAILGHSLTDEAFYGVVNYTLESRIHHSGGRLLNQGGAVPGVRPAVRRRTAMDGGEGGDASDGVLPSRG